MPTRPSSPTRAVHSRYHSPMFNLVVGGLGFIGYNLAKNLEILGQSGLIVDIGVWGNRDYDFQSKKFEVLTPTTLNWSKVCIPKLSERKKVRIWHLAANSDIAKASKDLSIDYELTLGSTIEVLKVASQVDTHSIEFTSSSAVYGNRILGAKFKESDALNPISTYGAMKAASEYMLKIFSEQNRVPLHIYRLANIIGPDMTHGLIFDLVNKLRTNPKQLQVLGNGLQRKTYMHVDDLIDAMIRISINANNLVLNVGPEDDGLQVNAIVLKLLEKFGGNAKAEYEDKPNGWPGDVTDSVMDTSKLHSLIGKPIRSSADSVSLAIDSRLKETI